MISEAKQVWVPGPLIIGAGPSGLAAAACLKTKGVPSIILEKDMCIASSWKLRMYERLKLHLPKQFCELPHFQFPKEFPTYPSREQFISYIDSYAKAFSIVPFFGMTVESAAYDAGIGFWKVRANGLEFICRWLIVATGENGEAFRPEITGRADYKEAVLHTSEYKRGDVYRGKKVLVVGSGNSGMEVCLDLCNNGAQPFMAVRDKLHILPREILGLSTFGISMFLMRWLPVKCVDSVLLLCARLLLGDTEKLGMKRPKIGPLQFKIMSGKTPVLDVGTLAKIKKGEIKVVPSINRFTSKGVEFTDGCQEDFDAVILATGYKSNVPSWLKEDDFFDERDGYPKTQFPNSWKGKNGLYAVGFTRRGLLGTSLEARWIAEDIATQWSSETRHLPSTSRSTSSGGLLADFQSESEPHTSTNEMICYLSMLNENEHGLDVMAWWRRHQRTFPTLAMMARDVFAVLVSTVPSESCFSSTNRILSDKRSKLGVHDFERLVCLKDWIQAEEHKQHVPEASSFEVDTEESGTEAQYEANSDSDSAEESKEWYMNENF